MRHVSEPAPASAERLTPNVESRPLPRTYFAGSNTPIVVRLKAKLESLGATEDQPPAALEIHTEARSTRRRPCPLARLPWAHLRGLAFGTPTRVQPSACCMHRMDWMIWNVPPWNRCSLNSCRKRPRGRQLATPQDESNSTAQLST